MCAFEFFGGVLKRLADGAGGDPTTTDFVDRRHKHILIDIGGGGIVSGLIYLALQ